MVDIFGNVAGVQATRVARYSVSDTAAQFIICCIDHVYYKMCLLEVSYSNGTLAVYVKETRAENLWNYNKDNQAIFFITKRSYKALG